VTSTEPEPRRLARLLFAAVLVGLIGGCYEEPVAITTYPPSSQPPGSAETPIPVASGAPTADCINGWISPSFDSQERGTGMYLIDRQMGVSGSWTIAEMRFFLGPDVTWSDAPAASVKRWYVKASLEGEDLRARWLIEQRSDLDYGVVAVAPYDTSGFLSPDWTGFSGDSEPQTYLGLPGQWSGTPYDFVSGGGTAGGPGLPDEVVGCVSDT
jgi:hypothetical protein